MAVGAKPWNKKRFVYVLKDRGFKSVNDLIEYAIKKSLFFTEQDIKNANKSARQRIQEQNLLQISQALRIDPRYLTGEYNKKAEIDFMGGLHDIPKEEWLSKNPDITEEQYEQLKQAYQIDDERVFMLSYDVYLYEQKADIRKDNIDAFRAWLLSVPDYENLFLVPEFPDKEMYKNYFQRLPDNELKNLQYFMIKALCEHYGILPKESEE